MKKHAVIPALRRAQDGPGFARAGIQHAGMALWFDEQHLATLLDSRFRENDAAVRE
jgi:hypothetical protein